MLGLRKKKLVQPTSPSFQTLSDLALESVRFTPDIAKLEQSEYQRVFIYDEMQHGHRANVFLRAGLAERDAICYTYSNFSLWKKRAGQASSAIAFYARGPWTYPSWAMPEHARIQGELYIVRSSHIPILDEYHRNGIEFERVRVKIVRPYRSIVVAKDGFPLGVEFIERMKARGLIYSMRNCNVFDAWMYIGKEEYWGQFLGRMFMPTKLFTSENEQWLRQYYSFTVLEYSM